VLSQDDRRVLEGTGYRDKLNAVDEAILANQRFLDEIVFDTDLFGTRDEGDQEDDSVGQG
jgi:carnosine N-methyltransferase